MYCLRIVLFLSRRIVPSASSFHDFVSVMWWSVCASQCMDCLFCMCQIVVGQISCTPTGHSRCICSEVRGWRELCMEKRFVVIESAIEAEMSRKCRSRASRGRHHIHADASNHCITSQSPIRLYEAWIGFSATLSR